MAKYDRKNKTWVKDPLQPTGSFVNYNTIAVDHKGNPAYIDYNEAKRTIHWRKDGKWIELKVCASMIAFGGDGSLF